MEKKIAGLSDEETKQVTGGGLTSNDRQFSIQKGDKIAIIGQSGAGKTTLVGMVPGLEEVDYPEYDSNSIHNDNGQQPG